MGVNMKLYNSVSRMLRPIVFLLIMVAPLSVAAAKGYINDANITELADNFSADSPAEDDDTSPDRPSYIKKRSEPSAQERAGYTEPNNRVGEEVAQRARDAAITSKILARLALEKDLPSRWISVTTNDGEVTLTGVLENNEQIDRTIYIVRHVKGVRKVDSYIRVGEPETTLLFRDTVITAKIRAELIKSPNVDALTIHVETDNGVVYLTGVADTITEKLEAYDIARSVDGVVKVVNKIKVLQRVK